jgi:hypothetical protein
MSQSLLIAFLMFAVVDVLQARAEQRDAAVIGAHAAAGLALSCLYGRMMPRCAMQKRVSPDGENALDNAGNSRATGGLCSQQPD